MDDRTYKDGKLFITSADTVTEYTAEDLLEVKETIIEKTEEDREFIRELDAEIVKIRSTV